MATILGPESRGQKEIGRMPIYAKLLTPQSTLEAQQRVSDNAAKMNISLLQEEVLIYSALKTPEAVQWFISHHLPYNRTSKMAKKESFRSPRQTLIKGSAHCFEGALFAFTANLLNGTHQQGVVLLESLFGCDHNIAIFTDPKTKKLGCIEETGEYSRGRPAKFSTVRQLTRSFAHRKKKIIETEYHRFSDPIDLVARFGTSWVTDKNAREIYYHYIDDTVNFHLIFGDKTKEYSYPLITALKNRWIAMNEKGIPILDVQKLPRRASQLWKEYLLLRNRLLENYDKLERIYSEFYALTGTTPEELDDLIYDFRYFIREGFEPSEIVHSHRGLKRIKTT